MRKQRFTRIYPFDLFNEGHSTDSFAYKPNGGSFELSLLPSLNSGFPDMTFTVKLKSGRTAPPKLQLSRAFRQIREVNNEPLTCYGVQFYGSLIGLQEFETVPDDGGFCGILFNQKGEIVKQVYATLGTSLSELETFMQYCFIRHNFDKNGSPIDAKKLKTTIKPLDAVKMEHRFTADVEAPTGTLKIYGEVADIRAAGGNPDKGSFSYFADAFFWPYGETGSAILAKDFAGRWHTAVFDAKGEIKTQERAEGFATAFFTAFNHLNRA